MEENWGVLAFKRGCVSCLRNIKTDTNLIRLRWCLIQLQGKHFHLL